VLHTWTRTLEWHPHLHVLVPAGGLTADGQTWLVPPRRKQPFLVPVYALAARFRGRFLHLARRAVPDQRLPDIPGNKRWVVFAKPVARPRVVLDYLARYVHRTALSDKAIVACTDRSVTFGFATAMLLAFGVVFEVPVVLTFLAATGVVNWKQLLGFSRYWILISSILAALLTPSPDVGSMLIMMLPLVLLYYVSTLIAYFIGPKVEDEDDAPATEPE
jgi:hypothetical protein